MVSFRLPSLAEAASARFSMLPEPVTVETRRLANMGALPDRVSLEAIDCLMEEAEKERLSFAGAKSLPLAPVRSPLLEDADREPELELERLKETDGERPTVRLSVSNIAGDLFSPALGSRDEQATGCCSDRSNSIAGGQMKRIVVA